MFRDACLLCDKTKENRKTQVNGFFDGRRIRCRLGECFLGSIKVLFFDVGGDYMSVHLMKIL